MKISICFGFEIKIPKYKRIVEWLNSRRLERYSRLGHFLCRPYLEKAKTARANDLPPRFCQKKKKQEKRRYD